MKKILFLLIFIFLLIAPLATYAQNNEAELFLIAQKAFEDGFYDVATRYIDQYLKDYPQSVKQADAKILLGQCFYFKGQYLKAFNIFQGLSSEPKYQDAALFWLGETYLKGKDYSQAKDRYQKIIDLYPSSDYIPQAWYALAWIDYETNNFNDAKTKFEIFIEKFPNNQLVEDVKFRIGECEFNNGRYEEAIASFQKYITLFPKSIRLDRAYFYIAESNYYRRQYPDAIKFYTLTRQESRNDPTQLLADLGIAWSYIRLQDYAQAERTLEDAKKFATERKLNLEECLLGFANLYAEKKDTEKALKYYQQIIADYPSSPRIAEAYLEKANLLYSTEQYPLAINAYQDLINKNPENIETIEKGYLGLAWAYFKSGDSSKAIATFQDIISRTQSKAFKASALTQVGDVYQDIGQLENALQTYDKILQEYPDAPYADYAQYRQGIALLKLGKTTGAILSFQSLEKNFPQSRYSIDAKYYLGVAHFNKGEWHAAKDYVTKFIENITPEHEFQSDADYLLALCHQNLKEYDEAIKILRRMEKLYPQNIDLVPKIKISIAKNLYQKNAIPDALKEFKLVLYKYPKTNASLDALLWLGEYYNKIFDFKNALLYYEQIVADYPPSPNVAEALLALGNIYYKQENYEKALIYFKQIRPEDGPEVYAQAKLSIADTFARQLDPSTAIQTYENIIKNSPEFARSAYIKIGEIYRDDKEYLKALAAYRNALNAKPISTAEEKSNAEIQFQVADLCETLNKPDEAISEYLRIPYLYPQETHWITKAHLRVARIFENKKDWASAKLMYEKIKNYNVDEKTFAEERLEAIDQILNTH